jgi:hypothetical protein
MIDDININIFFIFLQSFNTKTVISKIYYADLNTKYMA